MAGVQSKYIVLWASSMKQKVEFGRSNFVYKTLLVWLIDICISHTVICGIILE